MPNPFLFPFPRELKPIADSTGWRQIGAMALDDALEEGTRDLVKAFVEAFPDRFALGGSSSSPTLRLRVGTDETNEEAYALKLDQGGVILEAAEPAGVFYGLSTLRQILAQYDGPPPAMEIKDGPTIAERGFMLDISRCKVPTMNTLRHLVDLLADLRYNQFQLYTEHTFAFPGHDTVWENASPMTAGEVRELDAYCAARHIDLVPNLNSFGHMERWLRHPAYRHLAESPDGAVNPWGGRLPWGTTLKPDDASIAFVDSLYADFLPHFSSRRFNIGCDETWDLGQGASRERCEALGSTRVYLDFLKRICALVERHGRAPQFWGDIILHKPELIPELPRPITALVWGYEADHPWTDQCPRFEASGVPYYVCPGTSSWNSLVGRTENALTNISRAIEIGAEHGAGGILLTDWGDNGHHQPLCVSYPGLFHAGALSWNRATDPRNDLAQAMSRRLFNNTNEKLATVLMEMGRVQDAVPAVRANSGIFHHFVFSPLTPPPDWLKNYPPDALDMLDHRLVELLDHTEGVDPATNEARMVQQEARHALQIARHGAKRIRNQHAPESLPDALKSERQHLVEQHCAVWMLRNRSGGLNESCRHFD